MAEWGIFPEQTIDQCIKCNICVTACPVSAVTDLFPGPKYEGPQGGRFRGPGIPSPDLSVDYCSSCRLCNVVCPTGVRIAELNARARAQMVESNKFSPVIRLRNNLVGRPEALGLLGVPLHPLANAVLSSPPARFLIDKTLKIARKAPLPRFSGETFRDWFDHRPNPLRSDRKVVYFHSCSTEYYETRVGKAAVRVFEANGLEVIVPDQNCCGLPLLSNGEFTSARRYHQSNRRHFSGYVDQGYPIVGTSTSCTLTLKEEAPELLDMVDEETRRFAEDVYEFNEFILELLDRDQLNLNFQPLPDIIQKQTIPYHMPCQYRAHRLGRPAVEVLELLPGLTFSDSQAACCGIAGTYGYKTEKYEIAMEIGKPVFQFVLDTGADFSICDSETCRWQITHGTGLPSIHPAELLALAYGYEPEGPLAELLNSSG